ncbi:hypothetical protein G7054_g7487 [Neopestalotiopsis clavispora]|nr:hypothetical protein G7054_g7487 [Neopestalotiopsis clavispora]
MPARRSISKRLRKLSGLRARSASPLRPRSFRCAANERYQFQLESSGPSPPSPSLGLREKPEQNLHDDEWEDLGVEPEENDEEMLQEDSYEDAEVSRFSVPQDGDLRPRPSPSTFDRSCEVLALADGCSIPINHRVLPLYANIVHSVSLQSCECGGDAYIPVAALLRAWPDFARRVWGGPGGIPHERILFERDQAIKAWLEPVQDRVRSLLETAGAIDRAVSDAVQQALRCKAQGIKGVNGVTMDKWAREDREAIDRVEAELKNKTGVGVMGFFKAFT